MTAITDMVGMAWVGGGDALWVPVGPACKDLS